MKLEISLFRVPVTVITLILLYDTRISTKESLRSKFVPRGEDVNHIAHDDGSGSGGVLPLGYLSYRVQSPVQDPLLRSGGLLDDRHRRPAGEALPRHSESQVLYPPHRHEQNHGEVGLVLRNFNNGSVLPVPGADHHMAGDASVRERDESGEGSRVRRGDPRRDRGLDAHAPQVQHLLPAPAEEEGVADLQPHHVSPGPHRLRHPVVDLLLGLLGTSRSLPRDFQLALHQGEYLGGHQAVADHERGVLDESQGLQRQEARVARTGPHERHGAHGSELMQPPSWSWDSSPSPARGEAEETHPPHTSRQGRDLAGSGRLEAKS